MANTCEEFVIFDSVAIEFAWILGGGLQITTMNNGKLKFEKMSPTEVRRLAKFLNDGIERKMNRRIEK